MLRLAVIACLSLWLSGCFILEELRKGDALIEQHSVGWRNKKKGMQQAEEELAKADAEAQQKQASNSGPGVKSKLSNWYRETVDEEPEKANPDDKLVSCQIGGKVQFIRESDCQIRRGRAKQLESNPKTSVSTPSNRDSGA